MTSADASEMHTHAVFGCPGQPGQPRCVVMNALAIANPQAQCHQSCGSGSTPVLRSRADSGPYLMTGLGRGILSIHVIDDWRDADIQ